MTSDLISSWHRGMVLALEAQGHAVEPLLEAARQRLPAPDGKAPSSWEELIALLEVALARLGPGRMQLVLQELAAHHSAARLSTELLGSPRFTYLVLFEAMAAGQAMLQVSHKASPASLSARFELHRSLPPSRALFQCLSWALVALPRARGLGDARCTAELLGDRELELTLVPPPAPAFTIPYPDAAARTVAREVFRVPSTPVQPPRETPSAPTTQALQTRFALTRAEARVVKLLAEGRNMKRIAEELDVSLETARTHAKRAMQKTDTHRQAELVSLVLQGRRRRDD